MVSLQPIANDLAPLHEQRRPTRRATDRADDRRLPHLAQVDIGERLR